MGKVLDTKRSWVGYCVKSSGDLLVGGYESYTGQLWRLDDVQTISCTFVCKNWRLGFGLGGDFGLYLICFLNVGNLGNVEGRPLGDGWSATLNIPSTKLASLAKTLKNAHSAYEVYQKASEMTELANQVYQASFGGSRDPIIVLQDAGNIGLSAGIMRSFGGEIDIRYLWGRGGQIDNL